MHAARRDNGIKTYVVWGEDDAKVAVLFTVLLAERTGIVRIQDVIFRKVISSLRKRRVLPWEQSAGSE